MNKTYHLIFNKALGVMQVVSELAKSSTKGASQSTDLEVELPSKFKKQILAVALVSFCGAMSGSVFAETFPGGNGGDGSNTTGGASGLGAGGGGSGGAGGSFYGGGGGGGGVSRGGNGGGSLYGTGGSGAVGATYVDGSSGSGYGGGGGGGSTKFVIDVSNGVVRTSSNIAGGTGGAGSSWGQGGGGGGGVGVYAGAGSYLINTAPWIIAGGTGGDSGANGGQGGGGGAGVAGSNFTLINMGSIKGGVGGFAVNGSGGGGVGVEVLAGSAVVITNSVGATIAGGNAAAGGTSGAGIQVDTGSSISTLSNNGSILGGTGAVGILNNGTIFTLNNRQGASSSALSFSGVLPNAYNIIINSPTDFGKLAAANVGVSTMTFGVYNTSTLAVGRYLSVLTGVNASNLTGAYTNQTFGAYRWSLVDTVGTTWELDVVAIDPPAPVGPSLANTQASVQNTAQVLQGTYTLQNSVLANSFSYDCNEFGLNNICISAGGRNTAVSAANGLNNTSALLIAAYRVLPSIRVGAYADQNLSMNNGGSTVNLGNNTPLIGLFGAWNERLDGTGTEVKVVAAYGQKNTTVTRSVVGSGPTASEAGSGSSQLNSQGAQLTAKYGFAVLPEVIVAPYAGIRYTQNNMGGYTEGSSSTVTAPLTYSALNTNATTALAGVGASYKFIPKAGVFGSVGVETDTNTANGTYSATGLAGLTPVNFNPNPVKTRPTATLGAYYDVEKNQRIGLTGIYRQEPFQAVSTTTVMATYTVGL